MKRGPTLAFAMAIGGRSVVLRRSTEALLVLEAQDAGVEGWAGEPARRGTLWVELRGGSGRVIIR